MSEGGVKIVKVGSVTRPSPFPPPMGQSPGQAALADMPSVSELNDTIAFWRGEFGDSYVDRQPAVGAEPGLVRLWQQILAPTDRLYPRSILEVGANTGRNLHALRQILPDTEFFAAEPNAKARDALIASGLAAEDHVRSEAASDVGFMTGVAQMTFTSGVLIHVPPDRLLASCREIHRCSSRYIVAIEYFAAEPEEKVYRGHAGKLWKRDFGAFYLDNFPDLEPIACGFAWRRLTGLDDLTWVLLEKRKSA